MAYAVSAFIALALSYALYIPLPAENGIDRVKVQMHEIVMRVFYFYPMNAFKSLGVHWQVWWARNSLGFLVRLLRYKIWFSPSDGVKMSETKFDGIPVIVYEPAKRRSNGALVLIHGGGFVLLDADSYAQLARHIAAMAGIVVFSLDYRTAPEHIFPTALDDCDRAVTHLLKTAHKQYSIDPHRVAIMGDSAGGNLAAGTVFRVVEKDVKVPPIKLQVLLYPLMQFVDFQTPSYLEANILYGGSALADPESIARWAALYFGLNGTEADTFIQNGHVRKESIVRHSPHLLKDMRYSDLPFNFSQQVIYDKCAAESHLDEDHDYSKIHSSRWPHGATPTELQNKLASLLFNPDLSPMARKDVSKSPKTLVVTCQYDPLRDEGYWYMRRLQKAGVDVRWKHYRKAFHAIINLHAELDLAERMLNDVIDFLIQNL